MNIASVRLISAKTRLRKIRYIPLWTVHISFFALLGSCDKKPPPLPRPHVGAMEANYPWMIFNPTMEQGRIIPCGDKTDPDIVYLVFAMEGGDAMRVNLRTKELSPYHFNFEKLEDLDKYTIRYSHGYRHKNHDGPLWIEFRGKKEERVIKHMYGDPVANQAGFLKSEFRTGYYYIMDNRNNIPHELLRTKLINSTLSWAGLGSTSISPDGKWLIFVLDKMPSRTIIFNRKETIPSRFPTENKEQVIESW